MNREHLAVSVFMFVLAFVVNRALAPGESGAATEMSDADVTAALDGDLLAVDRLIHAHKRQAHDESDIDIDEARTWLRTHPGSTLGTLTADQALRAVNELYRAGCTMIEIAHDDEAGSALYFEFPPMGRIRGRIRTVLLGMIAAFPGVAEGEAIALGEEHGRFGRP